jgi:hypothetical protein
LSAESESRSRELQNVGDGLQKAEMYRNWADLQAGKFTRSTKSDRLSICEAQNLFTTACGKRAFFNSSGRRADALYARSKVFSMIVVITMGLFTIVVMASLS